MFVCQIAKCLVLYGFTMDMQMLVVDPVFYVVFKSGGKENLSSVIMCVGANQHHDKCGAGPRGSTGSGSSWRS
jgi:hypothetical protein